MARLLPIFAFFVVLGIAGFGAYSGLRSYREYMAWEEAREAASSSDGEYFSTSSLDLSQDFEIPRGSISAPPRVSRQGSSRSASPSFGGSFGASRGVSAPGDVSGSGLSQSGPAEPEVPTSSLYFGKITVGSAKPPISQYASSSVVILAGSSLSSPVSVTGWTLRFSSGSIRIPGGIEDYAPGARTNGEIVLRANDRLFLFGYYPFAYEHLFQKNIRLNTCTGYLNQLYPFQPDLPKACPVVSKSQISTSTFTPECSSFVLSLKQCEVPEAADIARFPNAPKCQDFLRTRFGYANCYASRRSDKDFFKKDWYAWTDGKQIPLAKDHDRVLLFDAQGLLVDEFIY